MNYLLDTHYVLWSLFEPEKINGKVLEIFQNEDATKIVSGVNLWEISLKYSLGKLSLENTNPSELYETIQESGFVTSELTNDLLSSSYKLPKKTNHRNPFDRLLIWQAITNGYTLITKDSKIEQYIPDGLNVLIGQ